MVGSHSVAGFDPATCSRTWSSKAVSSVSSASSASTLSPWWTAAKALRTTGLRVAGSKPEAATGSLGLVGLGGGGRGGEACCRKQKDGQGAAETERWRRIAKRGHPLMLPPGRAWPNKKPGRHQTARRGGSGSKQNSGPAAAGQHQAAGAQQQGGGGGFGDGGEPWHRRVLRRSGRRRTQRYQSLPKCSRTSPSKSSVRRVRRSKTMSGSLKLAMSSSAVRERRSRNERLGSASAASRKARLNAAMIHRREGTPSRRGCR